jgi:very-short-patch-repair endonuclease
MEDSPPQPAALRRGQPRGMFRADVVRGPLHIDVVRGPLRVDVVRGKLRVDVVRRPLRVDIIMSCITGGATMSNLPGRDIEEQIRSLAARQHGVVSRAQLLELGLRLYQIEARVRCGRLRPLHRGVYLVGPMEVPRARPMAAILCCGESAVLGRRSAAVQWQTMEPSADPKDVEVIVPPEERRQRPGVRAYRTALHADEVTTLHGIPITTPARTLYDLAGSIAGRDLEQVLAETLARQLTDTARIAALMKRYEDRPASRRVVALLGDDAGPALTRSAAEEALLAMIRRAQLPRPEINVRVHGHEVDLYWRKERLVAEMDGFAFHGSRRSFEADRRRDAVLAAGGLRVMRVTWRQLEGEPEALLVRLAQALIRTP